MARPWRGVIEEYRDRLPFRDDVEVVTLGEGGTPLVPAPHLSALTGCEVWLKCEGVNPTGSFKDRGMTTAITQAPRQPAPRSVICASTGNTSASAAAYATAAGLSCAVLVPDGKIALGKLSQAIAHGATLLQVDGNFDDCLTLARKLAEAYPVELVNSVNPTAHPGPEDGGVRGRRHPGRRPGHPLPAGRQRRQHHGVLDGLPGVRAADIGPPARRRRPPRCGASRRPARLRSCWAHPVDQPDTIATAIRIGNPASWQQAVAARDESAALIEAVTDEQILAAHRILSAKEGVFVEPASRGQRRRPDRMHAAGRLDAGQRVVCTVTGHGLKDPEWAIKGLDGGRCSRCGCRSTR